MQVESSGLTFEKVWLMFQETNQQFKETDKKLKKLEELFTSQWGKLVESLVEGDLVNILNQKGIQVHNTNERVKGFRFGRQFEFDIIAENGDEVVVVEVKTTLSTDDVKEFLDELTHFKEVLPRFKDNKVYGAVAYLRVDGNCDRFAEKKGLFVIRATGNSALITNSDYFVPQTF